MDVAIRVLRYLEGTLSVGLFYKVDNLLVLTLYCDADCGTCPSTT